MQDIKISIIVPVYNEEPFIKRCIESLIKQSYRNIEIIFVDDESKDMSREIIEDYKKKDPRIFLYSKEHDGRYSAKNYGMDRATGEFVMFCDADDMYIKDAVKNCVEIISENANSDGVFFDYKILDVNKKIRAIDRLPFLRDIPLEHVCSKSGYLAFFRDTRCCCIKREIVLRNKIRFENIALYSDILFLAKYVTSSYVVNWTDKKMYIYYQKPAHIKSSNVSKDCLKIFDIANEIKDIYKSAGVWENVQNLYYIEFLSQMSVFEREKLPYAKIEIRENYQKRLIGFINDIPYVYLAFISCYIDWNIRVKLLSWHKDHSFELNLCERVWVRFARKDIAKTAGRYIDKILRYILPSYRAATNLRTRQFAMQAKLDKIIEEQEKIKKLLAESEKDEYEVLLNSTK